MVYKFTKSSERVLDYSNDIAINLGHSYIGTEHILYGLAKEENGVANKVLENQNINADKILRKIKDLIGISEKKDVNILGFTPRTKKILENSYVEAKKLGSNYIGTEHILIGILKENDSIAIRILLDLRLNIESLYSDIANILNDFEDGISNTKTNLEFGSYNITTTLNQYSVDLTKQAKEGKLDPVIGRNEETERIIEILLRRTKNNPCLVGEPGVGKTAVVEGLAQKIILNQVPDSLRNKRVVNLDITSMVAGAKYRGDFEDRIKKCLKEVKEENDIIIFIDEIHTIVGAGAAEGAIDAANILKPLLARGEIQLIGATTIKEYTKYIEKDAALERRFQPIDVKEPTEEETIYIINGLRDKYEAHHNVKITDEAIISAVKLSKRYINDRFLPDKAIDVIDEASAKTKLKYYVEPKFIKDIENSLEQTKIEKVEAINTEKFEKAAILRDGELKLKEEYKRENEEWKNKKIKEIIKVKKEDVEIVISNWTGVPINKMNEGEENKLKNLENRLHKRVIGQNDAVSAISKSIRRSRIGLSDPNRPVGSFLFLGPTGVGKTELSKALSECLFGKEDSMIRLDMSEYMESYSVSKIIGAPPGYIGYDNGGGLTEKIRKNQYSVILFDEIEKAHPDIMNILLQILEDGRLTDSQGRITNFKNSVIIMTSNVGAKNITDRKSLGFSNENKSKEKENEEIKRNVMEEVKNVFKPELLNRIDEIIVFNKLNKYEISKIVDLMLEKVITRMKEKNIYVNIDDKLKEIIIEKGKNNNYGARNIRRTIQNLVEDKIAEGILNGEIIENKKVNLSYENENVIIDVK